MPTLESGSCLITIKYAGKNLGHSCDPDSVFLMYVLPYSENFIRMWWPLVTKTHEMPVVPLHILLLSPTIRCTQGRKHMKSLRRALGHSPLVRRFACITHSFACCALLAFTARFAGALRCAYMFAQSPTHSLIHRRAYEKEDYVYG